MKKKIFTESQILSILKQYEGGRTAEDLSREHGISRATLYNWKKKYSGMSGTEVKKLKELQEENRRLKHMYAELSLDYKFAKEIIEKKL
jgi:putative transposase